MQLYILANQTSPARNFFNEGDWVNGAVLENSNYEQLGLETVNFPDNTDLSLRVRPVATKLNDIWTGSWEPVTDELLKYENDVAQARRQRNTRLSASDWTQISDAPVDKQAWADYRQALRDVTSQPDFPYNIAWPTTP